MSNSLDPDQKQCKGYQHTTKVATSKERVNIWASMQENLSSWFVNNKGADQPAQPHSLICIFVVPSLESKTKPATCQVSLYD